MTGQTTAIKAADARKSPATIKIVSLVDSSI